MSRNRAILLTILGVIAAWLIIRGINAWAEKHKTEVEASVYTFHVELYTGFAQTDGTALSDICSDCRT